MQEVAGVLSFGSWDSKTSEILSSDYWLSDQLFGLSDKDLNEVMRHVYFLFLFKMLEYT